MRRNQLLIGFVTIISLIIVAGCVSTKATYLNPAMAQYPPVSPDSVRIITSETELDSLNYERIAIIEASGSGEYTNQIKMIEAMRKKAGKLGGNAVLLPKINEPSAGAKVAGAIFGVGTERKGNAIAIRILGKK